MIDVSSIMANFRSTLLNALLWFGVVLLPFDFLPLRFEGHETHRAGLTLVIAVGLLGVLLSVLKSVPLRPSSRLEAIFTAALVVYILSLILSTVFALSPTLALIGDLIRRMGLLTQVALVMLVFAVRDVDWRWLARGFWFAGVICAVYTLLQLVDWLPNPIEGRAFGPLGAPTFTASWLVNALIWSSIGLLSDSTSSRRLQLVWGIGLLVMVAALLATGGRGALLAVVVSTVAGAIAFAWLTRRRVLLLVVTSLIMLSGLGVFGLSRLDWQTSPLANWPLISRLNPTLPDTSRAVREQVWQNAISILNVPPLFTSFDGQSDRFYTLRPWLSYGQDHFEIVHQPYVDDNLRAMEEGRPIDRAHNMIFDLGVMHGAVGVLAWLAVWMTAAVLALRQLHHARQLQTPYWTPLLVLMIIVAHTVDLLFSFETLAGGWGAWLALGLLRRDPGSQLLAVTSVSARPARWLIITCFAAALLLGRGLSPVLSDETLPLAGLLVLVAVISLVTSLLQASSFWRWFPAHAAVSVTGMILGLLLERIQSADGAALIEILIFAVTIGALVVSINQRVSVRRFRLGLSTVPVIGMLIAAGYWFSETRAQINFNQGIAPEMLTASTETQAEYHRQAALDFPLDAKLQRYAAIALYQSSVNRIDGVDETTLAEAQSFGEASLRLNPYDANMLLALADIEYAFASLSTPPDDGRHLQRAMQLEESASRLLRHVSP